MSKIITFSWKNVNSMHKEEDDVERPRFGERESCVSTFLFRRNHRDESEDAEVRTV